ncbi:MAG: DUF4276 family protein, partial [Planctomycetota bacterium]
DRQPRTAFTATSDADRAFAADRRLDRQLTPSTQATTILTPTERIAKHLPLYEFQKPIAGSSAAESIGLSRLRQACPHFGAWLARLEGLTAQI